jgi:hypothetical protein
MSHLLKLQKQISRQVGESEYSKWILVIPPSDIEILGWKEGQELRSKVREKKLIIEVQTEPKERSEKMSYPVFRDKIHTLLSTKPEGMTWTEIKKTLNLPQKVPNNLWVRRMEREIGVTRKIDQKIAKTVWKLQPPNVVSQ